MKIAALPAGDAQNFLALECNHHCRFRSAAAAKHAGRRGADNVLPRSNEKLYLFRRREIHNRHSVDEDTHFAS